MSVKISELTQASSVGSSDVLPIVQSGTTKKVTVETLTGKTYSTTEQRVGTWIDGKPLYEKTYTGTTPTVTTDGTFRRTSIPIDIANKDISFIPIAIYYGSQPFTLPYFTDSGYCIKCVSGSTSIDIASNFSGFNGVTVYIKLHYTKTTDTANTNSLNTARLMSTSELVGIGDRANLDIANSIIEPEEKEETTTKNTTELVENSTELAESSSEQERSGDNI